MTAMVHKLARLMALIGGTVLSLLILITCVSILGRLLNTFGHSDFIKSNLTFLSDFLTQFGPIVGDFELVEAGVAFAIMAFLPLCQLTRSHASVELFTSALPERFNRYLSLLWEAIFAFVLVIIAWRLYVGTTDKMRYGETTFMLQFPVWWGYAACCAAAVIACLVAIYAVWLRIVDIRQPEAMQDPSQENLA
ncbi:MAG: TRAP transporter small permease [Pseudomonadota bacterium]